MTVDSIYEDVATIIITLSLLRGIKYVTCDGKVRNLTMMQVGFLHTIPENTLCIL